MYIWDIFTNSNNNVSGEHKENLCCFSSVAHAGYT